MSIISKRVFSALEPVSAADNTLEVFEQDNFELDSRITVSHELRPMGSLGTRWHTMQPMIIPAPTLGHSEGLLFACLEAALNDQKGEHNA